MKPKKVRGGDEDFGTVGSGTVGSASTGSYDTTEDLTDTDTSSNPNRKRSPDDKTRVRFAIKDNVLHQVESHNDFTPKERGAYWWSDREKDRMMAKHERLVAKYEQQRSGTKPGSKKLSEKSGSYRGLESWTAAGSLKLDHTIEQCITAVMDEQDRQWNENDDDADVIAQKSKTVTADSARRARLNGLQDAQEALRIRGESWSKHVNDEMSVGSAVSTGTAAVAKKKKRSKLLARLDDSGKLLKQKSSSDNDDDVLRDLKKAQRKKPKKSKKAKKSKKSKSSKSKKGRESDDGDTTDTKTTQPNTVASHLDEQEKTPLDNVAFPVSPLPIPETSDETSEDNVYPLLAALRQEQEKLKESSMRSQDLSSRSRGAESLKSIYDRASQSDDSDEDDIVALLRAQQRKNAVAWSSPEKDGGNMGIPARSGDPVSKLSSLREDYVKEEHSNMSDPPGRRPRRLASRQGDHDNPRPYEKKKREKKSSDTPPAKKSPAADDSKNRSNFLNGNVGGILRNGAKSLFKKGAKA